MRTVTLLVLMSMSGGALAQQALDLPRALAAPTGIVALLGDLDCRLALSMAATTKHIYYVQLATAQEAEQARRKAAAAGLLGTRIFVDSGKLSHLHLADDLVDLLVVSKGIKFSDAEARRVINPLGKAILGDREITKEFPRGIDFWTHPQHGPDNNPRALDQIARAPYLTQFIAQPSWCPMPQVSVAAGGRMYKAYGHIAHRRLHQRWLNTLIGVNAYNGSILWERPLPEGFMIHRNTMVATDGGLYMGDAESCRVHHPDTGEIMREIVVPAGIADGSVWKWMGFDDDVLYALVGGKEIEPRTRKSNNRGYGHWPWGMWDGHDFKDPRSNFGFGRTLAAFAAKTGKLLWSHREEDFLDGRAVCMRKGRIYAFSPGRQLLCLEAKDGKEVWRNSTPELLNAVGKDGKAQLYTTGFSTSYYMSCNDDVILFAGPQRPNMVAVSTATGELLWTYKQGNFQAVFLDTDLFVAGGSRDERASYRLDIKTGKQLHKLRARAGCTHATANLDSVFFRGGGTVRIGIADNSVNHITPMRPPCQDGVITSNGLLYWGPWMCGCSLSLYGHISLGSRSTQGLVGTDPQLQTATVDAAATASGPEVKPGDWPCYRQTPAGSCLTRHRFPAAPAPVWSYQTGGPMPSAPVSVGEMIYLGDRSGAIRGIDAGSGKEKWQTFTGGMVVFPPFIAEGRAYAGAADGKVYALDAGTGQEQWSYRIAPAQRWIPVFGSLVSTWPAVGGVAVADGKVYAAGGIAHYDDTHVVA
ncbi:MAG: PQQ-binding-like beta-propeller repeat protein, partial [Victivallales bacterium]|nr:PQQ-binding-like beta-propeller repeat protein [Victivallales bacterium]